VIKTNINFKPKDRINIYKADDENLQNVSGTILKTTDALGLELYLIKLDTPHPVGQEIYLSNEYLTYHKDTPTLKFLYQDWDGKTSTKEVIPQDVIYQQQNTDKPDYLIKSWNIHTQIEENINPKRILKWL
jgi:hypothetical protein